MMKQCPKCGQINVQVYEQEGRRKSVCGSCGWEGPGCFSEKWEPHNPKCAGGVDRAYWDDDKKTHQRPPCGLYQACAAEMNRQRIQGLSPLISLTKPTPMQIPQPPQVLPPAAQHPSVTIPMPDGSKKTLTLAQPSVVHPPSSPTQPRTVQVRPLAPIVPVSVPQQAPAPLPAQVAHGQVQPMMYQATHNGQPLLVMMVPPQQAQTPALVPQNVVQPGTQVMAVLTVPEPEELPYFKRFVGSVGRSMLKYGFMSAANMMDHVPWWR